MVLFPHDDRIIATTGEGGYVRWMDDQTIGAGSRAEGLRYVQEIAHSLARIHLTPNVAKSRVMSLAEARRYFHLDINKMLDRARKFPFDTLSKRRKLRANIRIIWNKAYRFEDHGEWEKILKQLYLLAGLAESKMFRRRALKDLLNYPQLAWRIADYMRWTGSTDQFVSFLTRVWNSAEQVYSDVNVAISEGLLQLEASGGSAALLRRIGTGLLRGTQIPRVGRWECATIAPLIIMRFGDKRSLPLLKSLTCKKADDAPAGLVRSAAAIYASYGKKEFSTIRRWSLGKGQINSQTW